MPTNYLSVPGATHAPSAAANPGNLPTVAIPADGDDLDSASVTQAFETLADFAGVGAGWAAYSANTRQLWIPATMMNGSTGGWAQNPSTASMAWESLGASATLVVSVPLFFKSGSTTIYQKLTAAAAKVDPAGASAMSVKVWEISNMSGAGTPSGSQIGSTANSSGTAWQVVTVSGIDAGATADIMVTVTVTSGQTGDNVLGVLLTYDNSNWEP